MCDLYEPDGCGTSFADKVIQKSRKVHVCHECGRDIPKGSSYVIVSGTWEGDFFAMKMCRRCRKASQWLMKRGHGWEGGSVLSSVRYCVEQELAEHGRVTK